LLYFYNYICNMNLRKQINEKGLKISWIANKIGVSQPYLSMMLKGERHITTEVETKIKSLLK